MLKNALFQKNILFVNKSFSGKNLNLIQSKYFSSSIYNSDRDKKLSQFFKMPSINNLKEDQIFDKSQNTDMSVLNTYDDEIDKVDLINKILKKKLFEEERKMKVFFRGNSDRENIKITENLVERLRLNKEFKYSEDFKNKEILNEYGNYDKYFENYKVVEEKKEDINDDGTNKWQEKYRQLQEKYNNPNSRHDNEKKRRIQLNKMIEDLNNYGYEFNFEDYLNYKDKFDEPDYQSTNPRDTSENSIDNSDVSLLDRVNNRKLNYKEEKQKVFGESFTNEPEMTGKPRLRMGAQDFQDSRPTFLKNKDSNPLRDRKGNPYHTVNLLNGPDEPPLEWNVREKVKSARNLRNKIEEIKKNALDEQQKIGLEEFDNTKKSEYAHIMARVSPFIKEDIYRAYLEGWTVKDLSYKYGLAPERIKCIVFDRDYFWKNIYPIIGESGLKERLKDEFEHARKYGMWEYGKDLHLMAKREQGILVKQITRGEIDVKPTKEFEMKMSKALKDIKSKKTDHVTIGFYGKGAKGYAIKEMIIKRGRGRKRVSKMFDHYLHLKDKNPQCLPQRVIKMKEYGPRMATLGYRF